MSAVTAPRRGFWARLSGDVEREASVLRARLNAAEAKVRDVEADLRRANHRLAELKGEATTTEARAEAYARALVKIAAMPRTRTTQAQKAAQAALDEAPK